LDDEAFFRKWLCRNLIAQGFSAIHAENPDQALEIIRTTEISLVLLDLDLGNGIDGLDVLKDIKRYFSDISIIMVTGSNDIDRAVQCLKAGAKDYYVKKGKIEELHEKIKSALKEHLVYQENLELKNQLKLIDDQRVHQVTSIVGQSKSIQELIKQTRKIAPSNSSVLIQGETGTGKELFADLIYKLDPKRRNHPFIAINCGAIPENLLEGELFGYKKGAYTGADKDKAGKFLLANGGVIFLDEINSLPLSQQVKLLRAIDKKIIVPLGATMPQKIDVKVITASNEDLARKVREGTFREDLLYRINVITINIPPLRKRKEDIPLLAHYFLSEHQNGKERKMTQAAMEYLCSLKWKGNVRELENLIKRLLLTSDKSIFSHSDIEVALSDGQSAFSSSFSSSSPTQIIKATGYQNYKIEQERKFLAHFIREANHNYRVAAKHMRLGYSTFWMMVKRHKLNGKEGATKS